MDLPRRIGEYTLVKLLGSGGTGRVYLARGRGRVRFVAVKVVHAHLSGDAGTERELFEEAHLAAGIEHPNVVRALDFGRVAEGAYLVMDYVDGASLGELLLRGLEWPLMMEPSLAVRVMLDVLAGLAAAHRERLVHRDVTPRNVLLGRDGIARICDFGLALSAPVASRRTKGTVAYMSPEQVRGEPLDQRTDVWSAGVMLWELLTGEHPFRGETHAETYCRIVEHRPLPPSELNPRVPNALDALVLEALSVDRELRFPSAEALRRELRRVYFHAAAPEQRALGRHVRMALDDGMVEAPSLPEPWAVTEPM